MPRYSITDPHTKQVLIAELEQILTGLDHLPHAVRINTVHERVQKRLVELRGESQ